MPTIVLLPLSGETEDFLKQVTSETHYSADEVIARGLALFKLAYKSSRVAILATGWESRLEGNPERQAFADEIIEGVVRVYETPLQRHIRLHGKALSPIKLIRGGN